MSQTEADWLVVPGTRVGRVVADSSEESLRREYGQGSLLIDDGLPTGTGLVPFDDPASMLDITWQDQERRRGVVEVRAAHGQFRWKTHDGLAFGTSVADAERILKTSFVIHPGGLVTSSRGDLDELGAAMLLTFKPASRASSLPERIVRRYVSGPPWESSDASMRPFTDLVYLREMRVRFTLQRR